MPRVAQRRRQGEGTCLGCGVQGVWGTRCGVWGVAMGVVWRLQCGWEPFAELHSQSGAPSVALSERLKAKTHLKHKQAGCLDRHIWSTRPPQLVAPAATAVANAAAADCMSLQGS
eukprot:365452-Chlamydomonas_euryale.AAC.23